MQLSVHASTTVRWCGVVRTEKYQFRTEKCQFRTEKCQFIGCYIYLAGGVLLLELLALRRREILRTAEPEMSVQY